MIDMEETSKHFEHSSFINSTIVTLNAYRVDVRSHLVAVTKELPTTYQGDICFTT